MGSRRSVGSMGCRVSVGSRGSTGFGVSIVYGLVCGIWEVQKVLGDNFGGDIFVSKSAKQ